MKKLFRPLAVATAIGVTGVAGTNLLLAQEKPIKVLPDDVKRVLPADDLPVKRPVSPADEPAPVRGLDDLRRPARGDRGPAQGAGGAADSKPDTTVAPVKVGDVIAKTEFAVKPKDLSPAVKKGLEYLVKGQQDDGGWNQGGGWRNSTGGGRVEGAKVEDPSDIGNTCFVLLALLRAGSTATEGEYKDAVQKGLKFVIGRVEKADKDSLYVTDVRGTQLQSKIGNYVDTFLVNLVLAEFRGKSGDQEKQLVAALEKTMTKIVRHQTADGGFAGNNGWATTLSMGICNKSLVRAKERGAVVDDKALARVMAQAKSSVENKAPEVAVADTPATKPAGTGGPGVAAAPPAMAGRAGDAGVALYRVGQGAGNLQDVVNSLRLDAEKARKVIADPKAPKDEKDRAEKKLDEVKAAEEQNDKVQADLAKNVKNDGFVAGFGNNGGEEFLSFMNISESLVLLGGKDWDDWDAKMVKGMEKAQDKDGSWQGHHCITGKTFCTAGALLVLLADRTPFPTEVVKAAREKKENKPAEPKATEPKPEK